MSAKGLGLFLLSLLMGTLYAGLVGLLSRSVAGATHLLAHLDRIVLARLQ